jgi:uncharacterized membrane protein
MTNIKKFLKSLRKVEKEFVVLAVFVGAYISYLTYFTFSKFINFFAGRYDLGNMDQTVWNTLHGRIFSFINPDFNEVMSRLSVHSDFILILLAPFYLIWEDARMLLLIQTVVIAIGAFFVYGIGKKILSQKFIPLLLALSYLINPYVNEQNMFDFHAISLATTFILAAFYFLLKNKYKTFSAFAILTLLTKEHMFLVMGLFGLYILFLKRKMLGLLITVISFGIFYLLIAKFIPDARAANHFALGYYNDFGNSPIQIIETFLTNPTKVFSILMEHDVLHYLKLLFMPVGYLSIFAPFALIFSLPEFFINILSSNSAYRSYEYHYAATIIPFIYISSLYAVKKILSLSKKIKINWLISVYIIFLSLFSAWYFGPLPFARKADYTAFKTIKERDEILRYMKSLPENISIAATNNIGAHLTHRVRLYTTLGNGIEKADMVLVLIDHKNPTAVKYDTDFTNQMLQNPNFHVVYSVGDFTAFKRN